MTKRFDQFIKKLREKPCNICGKTDKKGNHIIGYDRTDRDKILEEYYEVGDTLCEDCLFK